MTSARIERVRRAIDEIRAGRMVVLVDDEDRENEGDLCMAAELVTADAINFMARHGRGLICLTLTEERISRLGLPMMVQDNRAPMGTAFTVSIEARRGVTTGISAADRATTIKTAVAHDARAEDVVSPGHVFPLRARRGGVLVRTGQTEGSVDLARLAGLEPAGVICEIMRDDGEMARMPDLEAFAKQHGLMVLTIADLIEYRLQNERLVHCVGTAPLRPLLLGGKVELTAHMFQSDVSDAEYMALSLGDVRAAAERGESVLVRVQQGAPAGDMFTQRLPNVESMTRGALELIAGAGLGVLLYVQHKQPLSLLASFEQYVLGKPAERSASGPPGALRDFGLGAQVLSELGLSRIKLISNSPKRIAGLGGYSIEVTERVSFDPQGAGAAASSAPVVPLRGSK